MAISSVDTRDVPSPANSLSAFDWVNFFLAALMMGFGPFITVNLAVHGWKPENIGFVLTAGSVAGLITQVPAGALIDMVRSRRGLLALAAAAATVALLIYGLRPDFPFVLSAALIQGVAGSVLGPTIAAISLGLVGHDALAERLGRNQRFASIGGLVAAAIMGVIGYVLSTQDIFLLTATLLIPLLLSLARIHTNDIHFARSCGVHQHATETERKHPAILFKDHRLLTFAICLFLFQLANASLLTLLGQNLVRAEGSKSSLVVSALVVLPQIIVALLAPSVGSMANSIGRRPLLIIGLAAVPIRSTVFAFTADPTLLIVIQLLDGLSGATLGVLTALVVADLTQGTGRFNLAQGVVGALSAVGASLSTSLSGIVYQKFGQMAGLLSVTAVGILSVVIVVAFMPETRPFSRPQTRASTTPPSP